MRTVLVIDDNKSVRESLRFLFERRGYTVLLAEGGAQGLAIAAETPFDCAMVDVNMPGMNGVDVCRLLCERARASGRRLSVWMMTGARTPELTKRALEAGAVSLLGKPFDFPELYRLFDDYFATITPPPPVPPSSSGENSAPASV